MPLAHRHHPSLAAVDLEPWEIEFFQKHFTDGTYTDKSLADAGDLGTAEVLSVFIHSRVDAAALEKMPGLKMIATRSTGYDHIDLEACRQRGVIVCNVPTYGENTVAEQALALLLALTRKIVSSVERTRHGSFSVDELRGSDLAGKTAGVIGTGHIGRHMIRMLKGLNMTVLATDAHPDKQLAAELGFTYVDLDHLLKNSDVVTLHAPAIKETFHMLDEARLRLMKKTAFLINTARGSLIDTKALTQVLGDGHLAGVGLDVLEEECSVKEERLLLSSNFHQECDLQTVLADHVLLNHPRVIITPHNAFNTTEALHRILETTVENIEAYSKGRPINRVV